ncbi:MAG: hypothetical protein J6L69_10260 [Lachnospiraceae bacterium]|nr:hypothetical protein [Lachnospiraceae bacterium]
MPTPINNSISIGVPCYKSGGVVCYVYAYNNQYLTLAGNVSKPAYVNIDFSYRYD